VIWTISHTDLDDFEEIILEIIRNIETELKQELIESFVEDNKYLDFVVSKLKVV